MKTIIYRLNPFTLRIYTRTPNRVRMVTVDTATGTRKVSRFSRPTSEAGYAADVEINSQPTHRNSVLILEGK